MYDRIDPTYNNEVVEKNSINNEGKKDNKNGKMSPIYTICGAAGNYEKIITEGEFMKTPFSKKHLFETEYVV